MIRRGEHTSTTPPNRPQQILILSRPNTNKPPIRKHNIHPQYLVTSQPVITRIRRVATTHDETSKCTYCTSTWRHYRDIVQCHFTLDFKVLHSGTAEGGRPGVGSESEGREVGEALEVAGPYG